MVNLRTKDIRVLRNLLTHSYDPLLITLAFWCIEREHCILFTSGHRPGDQGVHGTIPCRALDIRAWNLFNPRKLCEEVNEHWKYDPQRPDLNCALYHARCPHCKKEHRWDYVERCTKCGTFMKGDWHIHLQVHPKTRCLEGG